ncbi:hypothetical protein B0J11DRAFT_433424, partial [Dendryphion nanum]
QTAPSLTETPGIQAPLSVNERITLGSTTLNLTPGLSTIIGVGTSATLVAMTTNVAGQTIIVISSSGTAISATVTKTAVVYTAPRTGFDAILTAAAKPADNWNRNTAGSPTSTTASKGGAAQRWNDRTEWWAGVLFGLGVAAKDAGFSSFKAFLESYGLRIWNDDDVEEGKEILRAMGYVLRS